MPDSSFNILGSSKLNTSNGKNPATAQPEKTFDILGSSKLNTADGKNPASVAAGQAAKADDYRKSCFKAHNELEARLRDEELSSRSRGW
jgi:hypothetical protein